MHVNEATLAEKCNITKYSVISSTQISSKATSSIERLQNVPDDGKPALIVLTSKARTASKLVSIAEIVKRELLKAGIKCFQYNALSSEMIEIERDQKPKASGTKKAEASDDGSDSEGAFQTLGAEPKTGKKKRLVPVMTVYLCACSVKELKNAYG